MAGNHRDAGFHHGEKPYDRPEVVVYVIEFQKLGLPHAYILLWLEEEWECKTPNQVDDIISAEIPSLTTDPEGYKVVTKFMLHGPCCKGDACTVEGICSKKFPRPFYSETMLDEDGYPVYRRRDSKVQKAAHGEPEKVFGVDKIKNYLNCRYLAPCEAVWWLFSFDIHYSYPSVMKLNFHLEDQHTIMLCDSQNLPALLNREDIKITMFTEWFELNKRDTATRELTYAEIPKRPHGFKELMTVNKKLYPTFKASCFAYGLLNDDKGWAHAILEADFWALDPRLRDLFVTMLLFYDVSRPLKLWEQTWELLSEDILCKKRTLFKYPNLQLTDEQIRNYYLVEIETLLNIDGRSLADFQELPRLNLKLLTNMDNRLIKEALDFDIKKSKIEHDQLHSLLNPEQRVIYEHVIQYVHNQSGQFYFVYGPGGTGKTLLYKTIISRLRSERMIVLAVASSSGRTVRSRFVIPLELVENSTCGIKKNTHLAELLQQVQLIIWDEAPMTEKYAFKTLDRTLRDILGYKNLEKRNTIFGGVTVLLGGDFRQILPVIPKGKRVEIVQACINRSELWKSFKVFTLTRSMRVNEIVEAKKKEDEDEATWIEIPEDFIINAPESPTEQIMKETFPDFSTRKSDGAYLKERAILTPRNDDADAINAYMF
ncbi:ATP-dependent DNA helicase PIF1-like protein [Tanacetum coccineum]